MTRKDLSATGPTARPQSAWLWTLAIAWAIYASSSIHRLAGGDSGELLAEACVGGNAHPPGYPLLLLILRAVQLLGSYACPHVPFVIISNHVNAAFAAGAAACVTHAVELLVGCDFAVEAVAAGLLFAFSALTWEFAIGLEVFALNNLLVGLLLVCLIRHCVQPLSISNLCMGALLCGLGLCNQHTIVLFEAPMVLWIATSTKLRVLDWLFLTLSFLVGISPYASTFAASQRATPGSWGDTSTLTGLLIHIFRREYGTFKLSPIQGPSDNLVSRLVFYATDVVDQFSIVGVAYAGVGVFPIPFLIRPDRGSNKSSAAAPSLAVAIPRSLATALIIAFTAYVLVFNTLANLPLSDPLALEVTRRFFLQPNLLIAVWLGVGLARLRGVLLDRVNSQFGARVCRLATVLVVTQQCLRSRSRFTSSFTAQHDLLRDFGTTILHDLPIDAVLLSYTDVQWNSVRYLQQCEHLRVDVVHLNLQIMAFPWFERQHVLYPAINFPPKQPDVSTAKTSQGYAAYLSRFIRANLGRHRIFLDLHGVDESTISSDQLLFGYLQLFPRGLVWQIVERAGKPTSRLVEAWKSYALEGIQWRNSPNLLVRCCGIATYETKHDVQRGSWEFAVVSIAHDAMYQANLARQSYWLAHGAVKTVAQLEELVVASNRIQHELNDVVLNGTRNTGGAISYELYAVEKNAVVSRQRVQLYVDALGELVEAGEATLTMEWEKQLVPLLEQRSQRRQQTIRQVEAFLDVMKTRNDKDLDAVAQGLTKMKAKNDVTRPASSKKRKRRKKP